MSLPGRVRSATVAFVMVLMGCGSGHGSPTVTGPEAPAVRPPHSVPDVQAPVLQSDRDVPVAPHASWTVLLYLDGRGSPDALVARELDSLRSVRGPTGKVNVVALVSRSGAAGPAGGLSGFATTKLLQADASGRLIELADFGSVSLSRSGALQEFVTSGVRLFPADHVALVLWGAGGGWIGYGGQSAVGPADRPERFGIGDLQSELVAALKDAGRPRIDVAVLDASLMGGYEVASALAPAVDRLVASPGLLAGGALALSALGVLADQPTTTGEQVAQALVSASAAARAPTGPALHLVALDLTAMAGLDATLGRWTAAVSDRISTLAVGIARARAALRSVIASPVPAQDPGLVDLRTAVTTISDLDQTLAGARDDVLGALRRVAPVVATRPDGADPFGMTIYFPATANQYAPAYEQLSAAGAWRPLLTGLQSAAKASGTSPARFAGAGVVTAGATGGPVTVVAPLTSGSDSSIVSVAVEVATRQSADNAVGVVSLPGIRRDGEVAGTWDRRVFSATQGNRTAPVFIARSVGDGELDIPLSYSSGSTVTNVVWQALASPDGVFAGSGLFQQDARGAWSELSADPDGLLAPLVQPVTALADSEWTPSATRFAGNQPLQLFSATADATAEPSLRLLITDLSGNRDRVVIGLSTPPPEPPPTSLTPTTSTKR